MQIKINQIIYEKLKKKKKCTFFLFIFNSIVKKQITCLCEYIYKRTYIQNILYKY